MNNGDVLTERKFSSVQDQKNEFLLHKNLIDNLPCIALILKKGTREIVASNKAAQNVGAVPGKTCFGTCADRENSCPFCLAPEVWATNEPRRIEVKYKGAHYEGIWIPLSDELYVHYIFDISERELAKESLQKEKEFIDTALDSQIDTFFVFDPVSGKAIRWNKAFRKISGYSDEEIASLKVPDTYFSNEDLNKTISFVKKVLKKGTGKIELELVSKDGSLVPTEYLVSVVKNEEDSSNYFICIGRDISERKQFEKALLEREFILKESQRVARLGSFVTDFKKGIWESSETLDDIFGIDKNYDRTVEGWLNIVHPDYKKTMSNYLNNFVIAKQQPFNKEYKIARIDNNKERWVHGLGEVEFDDKGNILKMTGTIQDIAERKKVEEQIKNQNVVLEKAVQKKQQEMELMMERLIRQEKLAAVGQVSGNIAHELRNPLGAIKQSVFFLNRLVETDRLDSSLAKVREHLDLLKIEIDESDRVITELLQSTKIGPLEKSQTDLQSVISEVLKRYQIEKNIKLKIELKPEPFILWADPLQMRQVILNLLSNGIQAVSGSGKITISAKKIAKNKKCVIKIQDDGPGVAPENLNKVFEPLYSSKPKGIGLGLSICKQIIESYGGSIKLTSRAGKGTTVRLELPDGKMEMVSEEEVENGKN